MLRLPACVLALALACIRTANAQEASRRSERDELESIREPAFADGDGSGDAPKKSQPLSQADLDELLARYAHEPKVEQVVAAALAADHDDQEHLASMASRSRLRGLFPHVDAGIRRGRGSDLRWTVGDELSDNRTTADDVMLFATLRFDLDRLLFAGEEVSLTREARYAHAAQRELIRNVVHLYFLRKRLLIERDLLGGTSIAQQMRIQETEALLDAFTAGAWKRMINARARLRPHSSQYGKSAQTPTFPSGDRR